MAGTFQEWPTYTQLLLPLLLRQYRPQIVHSTSHLGPLWGAGKHIITVHDLIFKRYPGDYNPLWLAITEALLPRALARASAIIADSEATRADLERFYGVKEGRVAVIYPGIDQEYMAEQAIGQNVSPLGAMGLVANSYILCLGPWVKRKNLGIVVAAFGELAQQQDNLHLVLTGGVPRGMKGDTQAQLLAGLLAEVRSRVHTPGFVSKETLLALMRGAAVLAYPSRFEGFGLPPLEAMAMGVPVVAARSPAVEEVTGGAALLADPDSAREWIMALRRVLTDPGKAAQLREAGKRRSRLFTWERCAAEVVGLYTSLARNAFTRGLPLL